ncbi:hypothetical protein HYX06_01515 [Candidatus Woesearchaeota archaeon]|nr:hypothetical protein [Candidatus Woesearchaeota archaeon]
MEKKMAKTIFAKDLLTEAQRLFAESQHPSDWDNLVGRVIQFGEQLRTVQRQGGITLTDPAYHRAAKIYTDELIRAVFDELSLEQSNPIWYDRSLAELT